MKTSRTRRASISDVVSQFCENCAALWAERELAWRSLTYRSTLDDLERLDWRIDAQLDGLRMCGEDGWLAAVDALAIGGPGEVFTACVLAFEASAVQRAGRVDVVLGSVTNLDAAVRPMSVALDWIGQESFANAFDRLSAEQTPAVRAALVLASAMRGDGRRSAIGAALESDCASLIRAGCWAAVRLGLHTLVGCVESNIGSAEEETRATAATAALLLGSSLAFDPVKRLASDPESTFAEHTAATLFRTLQPHEAPPIHRELFGRRSASRASLKAAAAAGVSELVPVMLTHIECPSLARVAAQAFSTVTGAHLDDRCVCGLVPDERGAGPTEDPADERTELDPDEGMPWPNPLEVDRWWHAHAPGFNPVTRYLEGAVARADALAQIVRTGRQVSRAAAAELLALEGSPFFDVSAPAFRQRHRLRTDAAWR